MRAFFGHNADGQQVSLSENGTVIAIAHGNAVDNEPLALFDRALADAGRTSNDVKEIAVDCGPDGFSTVRRRVSVAAALAHGLGAAVLATGFIAPDQAAALSSTDFKKDAVLTPVYDRAPNITTSKKKSPLSHDTQQDPRRALIRADLTPKQLKLYRRLEWVPATLVWLTLVGAIALSFINTQWAVAFIIAFDLYWFFRVLTFVIFLSVAWRTHRKALDIDWEAQVKLVPGWEKIVHLIVLPTYNESEDVIRHTFEALASAKYPTQKMIVVLAGEERAGREAFLARAEAMRQAYGAKFLRFIATVHPDGTLGEMKSKGANMAYAGPIALAEIDALGIAHEDVIVSAFDVDTVVHPQYFAHLTKTFLETPNRLRASYQPAVLYSNNIWEAMPVVRIAAFGTTFWLLSELVRPDRLFTFSSHSMPLTALIDVGWWQKDIVSEDSRIFLQCFIRYAGDYRVVPMHVPVSMDAVMADTWLRSLINLYKQQRRWAWGVEHFPYIVVNFMKHKEIPLAKRLGTLWLVVEGMYTWATAPLLIFVMGQLPLAVARLTGRQEAFFQNAPHTLAIILTFAMIGVFSSAILSLPLLPTKPRHKGWYSWPIMLLQWALLPFTFVLFGSLPAIEAQTRLALGKKHHLGFWVTPKSR